MTQSFADYLEIDAVNWSTLKYMADSPLAYRHALDNPRKDTQAMLKGRATHTAVLEPDRFPLEYAVYPGKVRRGPEWEQFRAVHADKDILKAHEYAECLAIRDAVRSHPQADLILSRGESEQGVYWDDGATGIKCKGRIDHMHNGTLCDFKTTGQFGNRFASSAAQYGYHRQLAFYRQGLNTRGWDIHEVLIIAAQAVAPYDVAVYRLPDELLDYAWTDVRQLLERLRKCRRKDEWLGAAPNITDLELPLWAYPDEEPLVLTRGGESFGL